MVADTMYNVTKCAYCILPGDMMSAWFSQRHCSVTFDFRITL